MSPRPPRPLLALALAAFAGPARAGDAEVAEHQRLRGEISALVAQGAWAAADADVRAMQALEASGELLSYEDLYVGAQISDALGDMGTCTDRLGHALEREPREEAALWLRQIDRHFAHVSLTVSPDLDPTLAAADPPFEPDAGKAVDFAAAKLALTRHFDGLVPAGGYTLGGQRFEVRTDLPVLTLDVQPPQPPPAPLVQAPVAPPPEPARRIGPRVSLGPAWTASLVRDPAEHEQPPAQAGLGGRASAGVAVAIRPKLGLDAEVGLQSMVEGSADYLHVAFASTSAALAVGPARLTLGVSYGGAAFGAQGVQDEAGLNEDCPEGSTDPACAWIAVDPEGRRDRYLWTGTLGMPGAQASLGMGLFNVGPHLRGGVSMDGGAWFDPARVWPWAQVGLELWPRS